MRNLIGVPSVFVQSRLSHFFFFKLIVGYLDTFVNAWVEVHSRFLQIFCSFFVSFPLTLTVTCFYWHFFPLVRFPDYGPGCHQHQSEKTHQTDPSLKIQTLSLSIITRNIYCFIMKQNVYLLQWYLAKTTEQKWAFSYSFKNVFSFIMFK